MIIDSFIIFYHYFIYLLLMFVTGSLSLNTLLAQREVYAAALVAPFCFWIPSHTFTV